MSFSRVGFVLLLLGVSACNKKAADTADAAPSVSGGAATASTSDVPANSPCNLVTEADVSAELGVPITRKGYDPTHSAGSTCNGNFLAANAKGEQKMVLMVQDYSDLSLFENPEKLHVTTFSPVQETPPGFSGEAKLFVAAKDGDMSLKSLFIRKNGKMLTFQTFFKIGEKPPQFTTAHLVSLGKKIAAKM